MFLDKCKCPKLEVGESLGYGEIDGKQIPNTMVFAKTSHGTQIYHMQFLQYKEDQLELVFRCSFCQLHLGAFIVCH